MQQPLVTTFCLLLTIGCYAVFRRLYVRLQHPLLNIVVLSTAAIIGALLLLDIPHEAYVPAEEILTVFIGPATVGLAVPLYRYRRLLLRSGPAIVAGVAAGALLSMALAGSIAAVGGLPEDVVVSILPKGVSIPFAVEIAALYDGIPALAAAFVVATGLFGALVGAWLLSLCGIKDPMTRGLALGTMAHAMGTVTALQEGELSGAMAGLAMILAGIFTALFSPLLLPVLRVLVGGAV